MPFKADPKSVLSVEIQKQVFLEMAAKLRVSQWDEDNLLEYAEENILAELEQMSEEELDVFIGDTLLNMAEAEREMNNR